MKNLLAFILTIPIAWLIRFRCGFDIWTAMEEGVWLYRIEYLCLFLGLLAAVRLLLEINRKKVLAIILYPLLLIPLLFFVAICWVSERFKEKW